MCGATVPIIIGLSTQYEKDSEAADITNYLAIGLSLFGALAMAVERSRKYLTQGVTERIAAAAMMRELYLYLNEAGEGYSPSKPHAETWSDFITNISELRYKHTYDTYATFQQGGSTEPDRKEKAAATDPRRGGGEPEDK